jgi:aminomethyltransferase
MLKHTFLHEKHINLDAKMVPFAGYSMPVSYAGIKQEHSAVRKRAGMFDVSHMGNISFSGAMAQKDLQNLTVNNVDALKIGDVQYSAMCNESGGMLDDVLVYRFSEDEFQLIVNASNKEKIWNWIQDKTTCSIQENFNELGILALQGPESVSIIKTAMNLDLSDLKYYSCGVFNFNNQSLKISRTGYTGEDGFEFYGTNAQLNCLWDIFTKTKRVEPCGLGSRDTLRLEAGYSLYGHELNESLNPIEAGLSWIVDLTTSSFIGKDALLREQAIGVKQKVVGLEILEKGIARQGHEIFIDDQKVGEVTSGTMTPFLNKSIAMAYISTEHARLQTEVKVCFKNLCKKARVVSRRFYKK